MPYISPWHLLLILIVALLIFGPKRLPEFGRNIARMLHELKSGFKEGMEGERKDAAAAGTPAVADPPATAVDGFCSQCGASFTHDNRYCRKCGVKLVP